MMPGMYEYYPSLNNIIPCLPVAQPDMLVTPLLELTLMGPTNLQLPFIGLTEPLILRNGYIPDVRIAGIAGNPFE